MINEEETFKRFGYQSTDLAPKSNKKIVAVCDKCGKIRYPTKQSYHNLCFNCKIKSEEWRENNKKAIKKRSKNSRWLENVTEANKQKAKDSEWIRKNKEAGKINSENLEWQENVATAAKVRSENPEWIRKNKEVGKRNSNDPKFHAAIKRRSENSGWRENQANAMRKIVKRPDWMKNTEKLEKICKKCKNNFVPIRLNEILCMECKPNIRDEQKTKVWRTAIFKRDNYTCQMCNQYGGKLNAHHILKFSNYPELSFKINNGITLCYDCHFHKVNQHEEEYEIEFLSKIFDNKSI